MIRVISAAVALVSLSGVLGAQPSAPRTFSKHVLAWADVRNGYQHESITHALSTIERLGWESGRYDTIIRTDSQSITKSPILFRQGTGIASNEQFLARNLDYFDAIFLVARACVRAAWARAGWLRRRSCRGRS